MQIDKDNTIESLESKGYEFQDSELNVKNYHFFTTTDTETVEGFKDCFNSCKDHWTETIYYDVEVTADL